MMILHTHDVEINYLWAHNLFVFRVLIFHFFIISPIWKFSFKNQWNILISIKFLIVGHYVPFCRSLIYIQKYWKRWKYEMVFWSSVKVMFIWIMILPIWFCTFVPGIQNYFTRPFATNFLNHFSNQIFINLF